MKKVLVLFLIFFVGAIKCAAFDYETAYNETPVSDIEFMHSLDPYETEDYYKYAWAPYPLFRTATTLYFKTVTIPPGYYILTARNIKGKDYVLFKDNGKVEFIIPVLKTEIISETFYERYMPTPKLTKGQKFKEGTVKTFRKIFRVKEKVPPPKSFIEAKMADGSFFELLYYYGNSKYYMYFRTSSF